MDINNPVCIDKVANGFIIQPPPDNMQSLPLDDSVVYVFHTIEEVAIFLKEHFPETKKGGT